MASGSSAPHVAASARAEPQYAADALRARLMLVVRRTKKRRFIRLARPAVERERPTDHAP